MTDPRPDGLTPGQIPCPDCGAALALPIAAVLAGEPIVCAACGLELQVKREDSAEALSALGQWYEETAAARTAASSAGASRAGAAGGTAAARRPRRPRS